MENPNKLKREKRLPRGLQNLRKNTQSLTTHLGKKQNQAQSLLALQQIESMPHSVSWWSGSPTGTVYSKEQDLGRTLCSTDPAAPSRTWWHPVGQWSIGLAKKFIQGFFFFFFGSILANPVYPTLPGSTRKDQRELHQHQVTWQSVVHQAQCLPSPLGALCLGKHIERIIDMTFYTFFFRKQTEVDRTLSNLFCVISFTLIPKPHNGSTKKWKLQTDRCHKLKLKIFQQNISKTLCKSKVFILLKLFVRILQGNHLDLEISFSRTF